MPLLSGRSSRSSVTFLPFFFFCCYFQSLKGCLEFRLTNLMETSQFTLHISCQNRFSASLLHAWLPGLKNIMEEEKMDYFFLLARFLRGLRTSYDFWETFLQVKKATDDDYLSITHYALDFSKPFIEFEFENFSLNKQVSQTWSLHPYNSKGELFRPFLMWAITLAFKRAQY